jgi:hypothetical protein
MKTCDEEFRDGAIDFMRRQHDAGNAEREFAHEGQVATFEDGEPITTVADRLGRVVVSMQRDWETILAASEPQSPRRSRTPALRPRE